MAKRFYDKPYGTFSSWTDINITVVCPKCGKAGTVHFDRTCNAAYFHYPLYFQGSYRGEIVWALNREHLQYLIDYLSADIRTVSFEFYETNGTMRSQSDMLPTFMKTAKNREGIVELLTRLQTK